MTEIRVSVDVLAEALVMTPRRVQQLVAEGTLWRAGHGKYDLVGCTGAYLAVLLDKLSGRAGKRELLRTRARLIGLRADILEMDNAERRGELLEAAEIADAWARATSNIRTRMLAIPTRAAALVFHMETRAEVQHTLCDLIEQALTSLADDLYGTESDVPRETRRRGRRR
jgi:phage terminase Nu1 subunit (DNA packaging protein)